MSRATSSRRRHGFLTDFWSSATRLREPIENTYTVVDERARAAHALTHLWIFFSFLLGLGCPHSPRMHVIAEAQPTKSK